MPQLKQSDRKSESPFPPTVCSTQAMSGLDAAAHIKGWGAIYFAQSTDSNAILLQQHPQRHTQK